MRERERGGGGGGGGGDECWADVAGVNSGRIAEA